MSGEMPDEGPFDYELTYRRTMTVESDKEMTVHELLAYAKESLHDDAGALWTVQIDGDKSYSLNQLAADWPIDALVKFTYLHGEEQTGVVSSTNERNVFVRFFNRYGTLKPQAEACDPERLTLL